MKAPERPIARGEVAEPGEPARRRNPLDYIAEEHLRQREICAVLDRLAVGTEPRPDLAIEVLNHLSTWLSHHIRDEDEDLFPLLRRRSEPEDDINATLDRLGEEHRVSLGWADRIRATLRRMIADNAPATPEEGAMLADFAARERRHLIVENAIVLPLARALLTGADLAAFRTRMFQRRCDAAGDPLDEG